MEPLVWVFVIILGIGALVAAAFGIAVLFFCWWWVIPLIGALMGGWIGFLFCLGLVAIIGVIMLAFKN